MWAIINNKRGGQPKINKKCENVYKIWRILINFVEY
jgi:hypothetical protein